MHTDERPAACENCTTPLNGAYCHACGQHAVNPTRHFGHAIEEVFESFWHLDGRVFRTLRDLFVPGRVACNYFAGQRARYIPPLRLFVVLTVITFFVGPLVLDGGDSINVGSSEGAKATFAQAKDAEAVDNQLQRALAQIRQARRETTAVPGFAAAMAAAEDDLREQAAARKRELVAAAPARLQQARTSSTNDARAAARIAADASPGAAESTGKPRAQAGAATTVKTPARAGKDSSESGVQSFTREVLGSRLRNPDTPWHERDNPVNLPWLPDFGNRWLNHRLANAERNMDRIDGDGGSDRLLDSLLAAVPSALFVLVPVFALMLKLVYIRSGRGYLEHLVVALYSHAYLLLVLLASFVLAALDGAENSPASTAAGLSQVAVWGTVPVYLLLMQRRVYRQRWWLTATKFVLIGFAYQFLVLGGAVYAMFAGLTSGG